MKPIATEIELTEHDGLYDVYYMDELKQYNVVKTGCDVWSDDRLIFELSESMFYLENYCREEILDYCLGVNAYSNEEKISMRDIFMHGRYVDKLKHMPLEMEFLKLLHKTGNGELITVYNKFAKDVKKRQDIIVEKLDHIIKNIKINGVPRVNELQDCTRVEVIDEKGRSYVNWKQNNMVETQLQDEGKTLKVFITKKL